MPTSKRTFIASGAVATGIIATGILAYVLSSGTVGGTHYDTTLDASSNVVPPKDWRSGYTRTGIICYAQTAATSECFAANALPHTVDATDTGWPVEKTQNNRIPINVSGACGGAPWVCATATMDSTSADPAGGTTASTITMGGGSVDATAIGYSNSTALDLRLWGKCSSGTLTVAHQGGTGSWTVNCTTVGGNWALLAPEHTAVTEGAAFQSDGSGNLRLRLSGTNASIWHATATEKVSWQNSTIPTTDATGTTVGTAAWVVDNATGAYWATSDVTKTETLSEYSGTCWNYAGTTIKLTGSAGCEATWYALSLKWGY